MNDDDAAPWSADRPTEGRILVIDDDPIFCQMMVGALSRAGFPVHAVANGEQGVDWLRENTAVLVISDIFMPRSDGLEVIRFVRQLRPAIPILAVSGGNPLINQDYLMIARQLGADRALSKPIRPHDLVETVRDMLDPRPDRLVEQ